MQCRQYILNFPFPVQFFFPYAQKPYKVPSPAPIDLQLIQLPGESLLQPFVICIIAAQDAYFPLLRLLQFLLFMYKKFNTLDNPSGLSVQRFKGRMNDYRLSLPFSYRRNG